MKLPEEEPSPEPARDPEENSILHFVLDGLMYSLEHKDGLTDEQAWNILKESFPDVRIVPEVIYRTRTQQHKKHK